MSRRSGSETRVRKHALATRWSPEELARLREIAKHSGCSLAEVLRQLVERDHRNIIPSRELNVAVRRIGVELARLSSRQSVGDGVSKSTLDDLYVEMLQVLVRMHA